MDGTTRYSVLDLASIGENESIGDSLRGCVEVARAAERLGYARVWYAEHHNSKTIASSAPAVLIAHVAAHTSTIRLGAGGVMLPNHSPLVIAEQFGTLASLHPGRIDLGLGRAPGTDQAAFMAMRRDPRSSDHFAEDVMELQSFLADESSVPGVVATPGRGTQVPLYILGSSLYGAQLAAALGLPFAFASHFAPQLLHQALHIYRDRFSPSRNLDAPYAMAAMGVVCADTDEEAQRQFQRRRRMFVRHRFSNGGRELTDEQVDAVLASPQAAHIDEIFTYAAVGMPDRVAAAVASFRSETSVDEVITSHYAGSTASRVRSLELTATAVGLAPLVDA